MPHPVAALRGLTRSERTKLALLSGWFFLAVANLWLLKPVRNASLLTHLGAEELPYVRLGSVVVVGFVVALYSRIVDRLSRDQVARGVSLLFAAVLVAFWAALRFGGEELGAQRWFVWAVFILVDVYATVMIGVFWTYTNDVVTRDEADRLYGPIGIGGILGGIVGGVVVDSLAETIGPVDLLLLCAVVSLAGAGMVRWYELSLHPAPRVMDPDGDGGAAFAGAREVLQSRYLLLIVGIVVGYELAAATAEYVVNVVFERAFDDEVELTRMFGRVGWIAGATALASQVVIVPLLLHRKPVALMVPPLAMAAAALGLTVLPTVAMAVLLSTADRGLNYSVHQSTKETLYVPLSDAQKYKAKAFIDMFVDRAAKGLSAITLIVLITQVGVSIPASLAITVMAAVLWAVCAALLGRTYARTVGAEREAPPPPIVPEPAE